MPTPAPAIAVLLSLSACHSGFAQPSAPPPSATPAPASAPPSGSFLLSSERITPDTEILWTGFLTGLRGFEHFADPIGNPLYFESPLINTSAKLLYLYHGFPDDSQLQGGDLNVFAVQARLALTDRLAFIATKDGYSWLDAEALPEEEGWNDVAIGFKYAVYVDPAADVVATLGARFMLENGESKVLQGDAGEASPFVSFVKGFDKLQLMGNLTGRIPYDDDDGNTILQWDVNLAYDLVDLVPGVFPTLEFHGLHYLSDADRVPLSVGGLDYTNLGSSDVDGSSVVWFGVGGRIKFTPNASLGATFEYPLTNRDADIFGERVTLDLTLTW